MALEFRYAVEDDINTIFEIEQASMSCPWSLASFNEAVSSDHSFIRVADMDGQIAGFAVFYLTAPESELPDIVVAEEFRGQGIGRSLLENSIKELQAKDIDTIFLEVRSSNDSAKLLYDKLGFEQIGIRKYFYSNPVEDAICMKLDLS